MIDCRRLISLLKHLFFIFALLIIGGYASLSGEIIPQSRRIDWDPGLGSSIPDYPIGITATTSPYNARGDGVTDDTSAIQSALNNCSSGTAVYLPAGNYRITSELIVRENTVLRGAGADKTVISLDTGAISNAIRLGKSYVTKGSEYSVSGDVSLGSTQIQLSSSGFSADYLVLYQDNKAGLVTAAGNSGTCTWCGQNLYNQARSQVIPVSSVSGTTVNLGRPVYMDLESTLNPKIRSLDLSSGAGLEDLKVDRLQNASKGTNILIYGLVYSWIKGVESQNAIYNAHIDIKYSYGCEIRDNYLHEAYRYSSGSGYGIFLFGWNSDHLIENNIIRKTRHSIVFEGGGSGIVIAYNYCIEVYTEPDPSFLSQDIVTHGAHPFMNLIEGNIMSKLSFDNVWGSSSHNTSFRNYITGASPGAIYGLAVVDIEKNNYMMNVVGNVLGEAGTGAQIWRLGYRSPGTGSSTDDPNVETTLLRHGNYNSGTGSTEWDGGLSDRNLIDSYYLTSKPSFFGSLTFPPIGPDRNPGSIEIPALKRYENMSAPDVPESPPSKPESLQLEN